MRCESSLPFRRVRDSSRYCDVGLCRFQREIEAKKAVLEWSYLPVRIPQIVTSEKRRMSLKGCLGRYGEPVLVCQPFRSRRTASYRWRHVFQSSIRSAERARRLFAVMTNSEVVARMVDRLYDCRRSALSVGADMLTAIGLALILASLFVIRSGGAGDRGWQQRPPGKFPHGDNGR